MAEGENGIRQRIMMSLFLFICTINNSFPILGTIRPFSPGARDGLFHLISYKTFTMHTLTRIQK